MIRYLLCTLIAIASFGGIVLGIYLLNLMDRMPAELTIVLITAMEVVYLYACGLAVQKYLTPMFEGKK